MKKIYIGVFGSLVFVVAFVLALRYFALPPLAVIQSVPAPGATHNPFSPVIFYFNRAPKTNEATFSIQPQTDVSITISSESSVLISPKSVFKPLTTYQITVNTSPPFSLRFETEQAENNTPGWNALFDATQKQYLQTYGSQDEALTEIRTKTPINEPGFQINYSYKNNTFTVNLLAPYESNKTAFLQWIKQKGVTDLSTVRIVYTNK